VEGILAALEAERGPAQTWAQGVLKDLAVRSPTSLKIAHRHVRMARDLDLRDTLIGDFRLARRCLEADDLYEGVRAVLIDRDHAPKWRPPRLQDVSDTMVDGYFRSLGADELALPTRARMQAFAP
jgi:enoyl-CoA hydratase